MDGVASKDSVDQSAHPIRDAWSMNDVINLQEPASQCVVNSLTVHLGRFAKIWFVKLVATLIVVVPVIKLVSTVSAPISVPHQLLAEGMPLVLLSITIKNALAPHLLWETLYQHANNNPLLAVIIRTVPLDFHATELCAKHLVETTRIVYLMRNVYAASVEESAIVTRLVPQDRFVKTEFAKLDAALTLRATTLKPVLMENVQILAQ